jgi:Trypsin
MFVVTAGGIDRSSDEPFEKTQTSTKFISHNGFNSETMVNDIAVIQMPQKFHMSE